MNKYLYILYCILVCCSYNKGSAQTPELDSLIQLSEQSNDSIKAIIYTQIADLYFDTEPDQTVIYATHALRIAETNRHKTAEAQALTILGETYFYQDDLKTALYYFRKFLNLHIAEQDSTGIARGYNNLGIIYRNMDSLERALEYYKASLDIKRATKDSMGISGTLNNIGVVYEFKGDFNNAILYYKQSSDIDERMNNHEGIATSLLNIGDLKRKQKQYTAAILSCKKGLLHADSAQDLFTTKSLYYSLYNTFKEIQSHDSALVYYELFEQLKDSIFQEEKIMQIAEMQIQYETEKKEQEISLQKQTLKNQQIVIIGFVLLALLVSIFAWIVYRQYQHKRKAHELLWKQKKDITDSIQYASRIQNALLPSAEEMGRILPEYFVFYKPKDIVSGDFYWIIQKQNKTVVVAADSTGHGVPGAFMSVLGMSALNDIFASTNLNHQQCNAAGILNSLRILVKKALKQDIDENKTGTQDGMDLAISIIDFDSLSIQYAGAYNPLYLIRNGECLIYKGDKMPVGIYFKEDKPFTCHYIQLQKNDCIYMFSDGYVDQIGVNEKKFLSKNFRALLLEIAHLPMPEQKNRLSTAFEQWKQNRKQIDDILVLGIRI